MNPVAQRNRKNEAFRHIQNAHVSEDVQLLCDPDAPQTRREEDLEKQSKQLAKSQWQILTLTSQMNNLLLEPQVLIADPLGNIILRHQLPEKIEQQAAFGKAIIADMKKLLKYSKVG